MGLWLRCLRLTEVERAPPCDDHCVVVSGFFAIVYALIAVERGQRWLGGECATRSRYPGYVWDRRGGARAAVGG